MRYKDISSNPRISVIRDIENLRRVLPKWIDHKINGTLYDDWTPTDYVGSAQRILWRMNKPWLASLLESYGNGRTRFEK